MARVTSSARTVRATVSAVEGVTITALANISVGCERCDRGEGCGGGLFGTRRDAHVTLTRITGKPLPVVGESIELIMSDRSVLLSAAVAYGLPLTGLLVAVLLGALAGSPSDLITMLLAIFGLLGGGIIGRVLSYRCQLGARLQWRALAS